MKSKGAVFGLGIIIAALAFCAFTFKSTLINYVPFADARSATDTTVQIMGAPKDAAMAQDGGLHFVMNDGHGTTIPVVYSGPKPEDFDTAVQRGYKIAAQGTYDPRQQAFVAQTLLVKCPSKYQGAKQPPVGPPQKQVQ